MRYVAAVAPVIVAEFRVHWYVNGAVPSAVMAKLAVWPTVAVAVAARAKNAEAMKTRAASDSRMMEVGIVGQGHHDASILTGHSS
jgi:hypothetical protein